MYTCQKARLHNIKKQSPRPNPAQFICLFAAFFFLPQSTIAQRTIVGKWKRESKPLGQWRQTPLLANNPRRPNISAGVNTKKLAFRRIPGHSTTAPREQIRDPTVFVLFGLWCIHFLAPLPSHQLCLLWLFKKENFGVVGDFWWNTSLMRPWTDNLIFKCTNFDEHGIMIVFLK